MRKGWSARVSFMIVLSRDRSPNPVAMRGAKKTRGFEVPIDLSFPSEEIPLHARRRAVSGRARRAFRPTGPERGTWPRIAQRPCMCMSLLRGVAAS
jgi:hypothetical protein